jgi:hypothetical protein
MRFVLGVIAAVALAATPIGEAAARGVTKAQIERALSDKGHAVQSFQPNSLVVFVGDFRIVVIVDGADSDVTYLTYIPHLTIRQVGHEFLTRFNREVKFGRAYVDRDGDITLQMDRNSTGGVTVENIQSDFDVFLLLISRFLSDLEAHASA